MSDTVQRVQARARELAGSGKFAGWRALAFELQFEPGSSKPTSGSIARRPKRSWTRCAVRREDDDKSNP